MADPARAGRIQFALAVGLDVLGAAAVLVLSGRTWQTVRAARPRPLADAVLSLSGRTLDGSLVALALVGLAAALAVLATRGVVRRGIGVIVGACGAVLVWRSVAGLSAVSDAAARARLTGGVLSVGITGDSPVDVRVSAVWPLLTLVGALVMLVAGGLVLARGHRWWALSARYEAPAARSARRAQPARSAEPASLWSALDRGDDPTG